MKTDTPVSTDETVLVLRAQLRDEVAFRELVTRYERQLLYYVFRLQGNSLHGSDILQEVWLTVFRKINSLRSPQAFRSWLYRIAHDITVSHLRKNRHAVDLSGDEHLAGDSVDESGESEYELLEQAEQVHQALGRLSFPHREVLTLRFLEDLKLSEIAHVVGCDIGTVKSRLHYAKVALRSILKDQEV